MDEDIKLIELYILGDDNALKEIINKYTPQVYNFVRHFIGGDEANDVTQEVFIKIWKNLKKFNKDKSSFKTWIFVVARNTVIDFTRKRKNIPFSSLDDEENIFEENIKDEILLPDEALQKLQDADFLNSMLEKLSEQYKLILILHYQEEMTFREIAEILKKPLNTVKNYHFRAIKQLKDMIAPKES
jgi:RNA polymerase sigma-70 factor (ECF subfamily)